MPDPTLGAAILVGGQARRLGGVDKSRLVVADDDPSGHSGRTIIVRQVDLLQRMAGQLLVVTSVADRSDRPDRFADLPVTVVTDRVEGVGALAGLHAALVASTTARIIVVAGDLPWLTERVLRALADVPAWADGRWVRTTRGPEPLVACYRRCSVDRVARLLRDGVTRASAIGDVLAMDDIDDAALAALDPSGRALTNVNTPDDLRRVQSTVA